MKALIYDPTSLKFAYKKWDSPTSKNKSNVVVDVLSAGLNRRDFWITQGMYPNIPQRPIILGSDGCVSYLGEKYIVNPNINWGAGNLPSSEYEILGLETSGTFAQKLSIEKEKLWLKPQHLSDIEAAGLPLSGLTAYRALFGKAKVTSKDKVLISGVGGGVASMAFQMVLSIGCDVWVTSGSIEKINKAKELGAQGGANYKDKEEMISLSKSVGKFDVVIDSAGGPGFSTLLKMCAMGARVVSYGATTGAWQNISAPNIFFKQISIFGSTMGSDSEFDQMIKMIEKHKITPIIDSIYPLASGGQALEKMALNKHFGKIVLTISDPFDKISS
jgi:NADPH:quinone reductase-like Zn-dependent oxidoreductase